MHHNHKISYYHHKIKQLDNQTYTIPHPQRIIQVPNIFPKVNRTSINSQYQFKIQTKNR